MNISATRGDSARFLLTLTEDGDPLDLTDAEVWMTAKRHLRDTDADAVFQKSVGDGITITDDAGGLAQVDLEPGDTSALPTRVMRLHYDVQVKTQEDRVLTPISGTLTVSPDVTLAIA
jgi:hypothetical protein